MGIFGFLQVIRIATEMQSKLGQCKLHLIISEAKEMTVSVLLQPYYIVKRASYTFIRPSVLHKMTVVTLHSYCQVCYCYCMLLYPALCDGIQHCCILCAKFSLHLLAGITATPAHSPDSDFHPRQHTEMVVPRSQSPDY